jgi:hypothetical protein
MKPIGRWKSFVLRGILVVVVLVLLLVVAVVARCLYTFRDRNPGYELALRISADAALCDPRPLQAGFSKVNITPALGDPERPVWLAGFSQNRAATAVHDDLWASACVLDDGHTRVGIVSLDAIGCFHDDVIAVRRRLPPQSKLDYAVICTTHNHSTPDLMGLWGPSVLQSGVDPRYREQVIQAAADALVQAVSRLQPVKAAFHHLPLPPDGLVTDTRKPIVFDPDLRVMQFLAWSGDATVGTLVTWGNHPETVWGRNTEITSDYCGFLRDALEHGVRREGKLIEPGVGGTHVFVNGAVGGLMTTSPNVTVRDPYLDQEFKEPTHDKSRAVAHRLVERMLPALRAGSAAAQDHLPMAIQAKTLELPLANPAFLLAPALGLIDRGQVRWRTLRTEVALLSVGDVTLACIPGEIYPELVNGGIEQAPGADFEVAPVEVPPLRELMPGRMKFVFGLANDEIGYIIPKSQWDEKPPYLYGSSKRVYGEINSVGPETAPLLHRAFLGLSQDLRFCDTVLDLPRPSAYRWLRPNPQAVRLEDDSFSIRIEPGNMWGGGNDARNVLVASLPELQEQTVALSATVANRPTAQYEQVDLVWYYDDSHMVKLGHELVDGQVCIVMGREEADRTRTLGQIPIEAGQVDLMLIAQNRNIQGFFRPTGTAGWVKAGECDLPAHGQPHLSLQCYQGPADAEHWATISHVRARAVARSPAVSPRKQISDRAALAAAGVFRDERWALNSP